MRKQSGDTLVEVLLATVLLSVVLAGAYTLSNRATRINQQAFERTQITNRMQQQAELVRAARDTYEVDPAPWNAITGRATTIPTIDASFCNDLTTLSPANAFTLNATDPVSLSNGVGTFDSLYRVWIQIERGSDTHWDAHVFGCWESIGSTPNNRTALIIRLEDPT